MAKQQDVPSPEWLDGGYDLGLGYCLQCVAEYKISGQQQELFPRFAVCMAPITGAGGTGATCFQHLNVQQPRAPQQPPQVPLSPQEVQAMNDLVMPNGQPMRARHAR